MTTLEMTAHSNALVPTLPLTNEHDLDLPPTVEEMEKTATFLATEYQEATAEIARLMEAIQAQTERLHTAFKREDDPLSSNYFEIGFTGYGRRYTSNPERIFKEMKRYAWERLVDALGVKNVMSVKQREEFEKQLQNGDLPDITPEAILSILGGLAGQAQDFAVEAAREVFDLLRPQRSEYKTNNKYRVGKRVILNWYVERVWHGRSFRVSYYHEKHLRAIDAVFHLLDGKGVIRDNKTPLLKAIEQSEDGKGETEYFKFKCFKNRNLHLEFKNLDLVKHLNLKAAGEYTLGQEEE